MTGRWAHASDESLLTAARTGDDEAFGELWQRHSGAGRQTARAVSRTIDPDDLVSEAYLRILSAIRNGHGPKDSFRPYLYSVIRNLAMHWDIAPTEPLDEALDWPDPDASSDAATTLFEHTVTVDAFTSLPEQWRSVLWYTEVEGMSPQEVAPLLGLTANGVAARSYRARAGLKKAWVRAHVRHTPADPECARTIELLHKSHFGSAVRLEDARARRHLEGCAHCTAAASEFQEATARLAIILLIATLGPTAAAAVAAARSEEGAHSADGGGTGAGAGASVSTAAATFSGRAVVGTATGVGLVAALIIAGVVFAGATTSEASETEPLAPMEWPVLAPPPAAEETTSPPTASSAVAPQAPTVPRRPSSAPPVDSTVPPETPEPELPTDPEPPAEPPDLTPPPALPGIAIDFDPASGVVTLTGTGARPGATIEVRGHVEWITSPGTFGPEVVLASTTVPADGAWATPVLGGITPLNVTVWVVQISAAGVESPATTVITDAFFGTTIVDAQATVCDGIATWTLQGWPGASWRLVDSAHTTISEGVFDANGTAQLSVPLGPAPSGTTLTFQAGYVSEGFLGAMGTPLTAIVP